MRASTSGKTLMATSPPIPVVPAFRPTPMACALPQATMQAASTAILFMLVSPLRYAGYCTRTRDSARSCRDHRSPSPRHLARRGALSARAARRKTIGLVAGAAGERGSDDRRDGRGGHRALGAGAGIDLLRARQPLRRRFGRGLSAALLGRVLGRRARGRCARPDPPVERQGPRRPARIRRRAYDQAGCAARR